MRMPAPVAFATANLSEVLASNIAEQIRSYGALQTLCVTWPTLQTREEDAY